jgi:hypothetical protein
VLLVRYPYGGPGRPPSPLPVVKGVPRAPFYVEAVALRAEWPGWSRHHRNTLVWRFDDLADANELAVTLRLLHGRFDPTRVRVSHLRPRNRPGRLYAVVEEGDPLAHPTVPMPQYTYSDQEEQAC